MGRRAPQNACQTCRERHLKCDSATAPCSNCTKSKRECKASPSFLFRPISRAGKGPRDHRRRPANYNTIGTAVLKSRSSPSLDGLFIDETPAVIRTATSLRHNATATISPPLEPEGDLSSRGSLGGSSGAVDLQVASYRKQIVEAQQPSRESYKDNTAYNDRALMPKLANGLLRLEEHCFRPVHSILSDVFERCTRGPQSTSSPAPSMAPRISQIQCSTTDWTVEDSFTIPSPASPSCQKDSPQAVNPLLQSAESEALQDRSVRLSELEADLFCHFIQIWGPLLDATDESRQFSTAIPQLARTESPCLLYAIIALAAFQLSRTSNYMPETSKYYRKKCAQVLVPTLLAEPESIHEASIFATYVLLRVYDHLQISVTLSERQPESLFSESLALSTKPWDAYSNKGTLKRAAFLIHLRQDIHVALQLECPILVDHTLFEQTIATAIQITDEDSIARNISQHPHDEQQYSQLQPPPEAKCNPRVECAWTNRLVGLTCRIINYCFDSRAKSIPEWTLLFSELEAWNIGKPKTFQPLFELSPDSQRGRPFPKILLQNDWHVLGLMYYHISVVLLRSNCPESSFQKKDLRSISYNVREEIVHHVRVLCGIVMTNPIDQALLIVVAMLNVSAYFFSDEHSQRGVLDLLELAKNKIGAYPDTTRNRLCQLWGSHRQDNVYHGL